MAYQKQLENILIRHGLQEKACAQLYDSSSMAPSRRIYYCVKPLLPSCLRVQLRRQLADIQKKKYAAIWPIYAPAAAEPTGWRGWPDGKRFALLLTHDVDSALGNDNVPRLVELEQSLGFTSTFFFVPEWYDNPEKHHGLLRQNGFEIAVHGLKHDGKLYQSEKIFNQNADRINTYVRTWSATGFRAPCMHHNLSWHHRLQVRYDASTYDTDPFEPQGGGAGTIFPFRVTDAATGHSYIELPYTLPQDFLLFVLLRETTTAIWKQKLNWIAAHGGMAHVIVHPDYMTFNGDRCGMKSYPAALYSDFLQYIKTNYAGQYWLASAGQAAQYWNEQGAPVAMPRHKVERTPSQKQQPGSCMLVFAFYPMDVRVRREAEALQERGIPVDVVCLKHPGQLPREIINGVTVYRLPLGRSRKESKLEYLWKYFLFFVLAAAKITRLYFKKRHQVLHIHNMPDFLAFCALVPRLAGAKIILDLHDPMPEVYMAKYFLSDRHPVIRLLRAVEKASIRFADMIITPNISFRDLFASRSCEPEKIRIIMNCPQEHLFSLQPQGQAERQGRGAEKFTIMFHGVVVQRHGLDTALAALAQLRRRIPRLAFEVYGDGEYVERFLQLRDELGLADAVTYHGGIPQDEIPVKINGISVGLIPNNRSPFTEINLPTRIFEYLAMGKPVIVPRTKGILDYFTEDQIFYFEPGDIESLCRVLLTVHNEPETVQEKLRRGRAVYLQHTWKEEKKRLVDIVRRVGRSRGRHACPGTVTGQN